MTSLATPAAELLWRNALAVIPLAVLVAILCRWVPCRPWTRHTLWLIVLLWLIIPPVFPAAQVDVAASVPEVERSANEPPRGTDAVAPFRATMQAQRRAASVTEHSPALDVLSVPTTEEVAALGKRGRRSAPVLSSRQKLTREPVESNRPRRRPRPDTAPRPRTSARLTTGAPSIVESTRNLAVERADLGLADPTQTAATEVRAKPDRYNRPPKTRTSSSPAVGDGRSDTLRIASTDALPADQTRPGEGGLSQWKPWIADILAVRDALGRVSPIPWSLWAGGAGLIILLRLVSTARLRRRVRSGQRATRNVQQLVATCARNLNLRRVPETVMVRGRMSPMLWYGRRKTLVLPTALWAALDDVGREAVVMHELAHLRRRDHWVGWLDLLIGCVYWWHPVVWWVRSRVHSEAEACCDAWVIWLLPQGRRAYATALLTARRFVSEPAGVAPAMGMVLTTQTAKRFAGRITMIMTNSDTPRRSVSGIVLVLAVALGGWLATPAQSCDTKEKHKCKPTKHVCPPEKPCAPAAPVAPSGRAPLLLKAPPVIPAIPPLHRLATPGRLPRVTAPACSPPARLASFGDGPYVLVGDKQDAQHRSLEARLEVLEKQLQRLSEQLERMSGGSHSPFPVPPMSLLTPFPPDAPDVPLDEQETTVRAYQLADGKLQALSKLMKRSDVPVLVSPKKDRIEVHGTAAQHRVFKAFVDMIEGREKPQSLALALGTPAYENATQRYLDAMQTRERDKSRSKASREKKKARKSRVRADKKAKQAKDKVASKAQEAAERASEMKERGEDIERRADVLEEKVRAMEEQADAMRGQAESLEKSADAAEGDARRELQKELRIVEASIRKLDRSVDSLHREIERLFDQADEMHDKAATWEERALEYEEETVQLEAEADSY
ncbi:MAG: hypothetical protein GY842_22155 [bacterium]|nr:hypothetical protein [bacterium]